MGFSLDQMLAPCVLVSIILTVIFSEMIKKADKKDRLKGYRVYLPLFFSVVFSVIMAFGDFYEPKQTLFYGCTIFAISTFGYEAIYRKIKAKLYNDDPIVDAVNNESSQVQGK